jgi:hypothetical protein
MESVLLQFYSRSGTDMPGAGKIPGGFTFSYRKTENVFAKFQFSTCKITGQSIDIAGNWWYYHKE